MEMDRNSLEVLDRGQCLRLLRQTTAGRVGVTMGALPVILPVNFWCDGGRILIRTTEGTKLDAALHHSVVAFEVDDIDPLSHSGWSVMVTGVAEVVTDPCDRRDLLVAPLALWAPLGEEHLVSIPVEMVSGRRIIT